MLCIGHKNNNYVYTYTIVCKIKIKKKRKVFLVNGCFLVCIAPLYYERFLNFNELMLFIHSKCQRCVYRNLLFKWIFMNYSSRVGNEFKIGI